MYEVKSFSNVNSSRTTDLVHTYRAVLEFKTKYIDCILIELVLIVKLIRKKRYAVF